MESSTTWTFFVTAICLGAVSLSLAAINFVLLLRTIQANLDTFRTEVEALTSLLKRFGMFRPQPEEPEIKVKARSFTKTFGTKE